MDGSPAESKVKARKIAIKVTEQPEPVPVAPVPAEPNRKALRNSYIYIGIGVFLVALSSLDIYDPGPKGQASVGLLVVGGLWLAYGIFRYMRAKA